MIDPVQLDLLNHQNRQDAIDASFDERVERIRDDLIDADESSWEDFLASFSMEDGICKALAKACTSDDPEMDSFKKLVNQYIADTAEE